MAPYTPGEQPRAGENLIKLNTNENPYPPSPKVRRAVNAAARATLRLYPPPRADGFVAAASRLYGIDPEMIVAGNGSDELLAMIFRAALGRGDSVAYPVPTYSLYDTLAEVQEAKVRRIPFGPEFKLPYEKLARARAALTIICNPNSPSGSFAPVGKLSALARALAGRLLVIDEAYVDFAADNALRLLSRHRNVIILRTLSKSFSLAGMRLGLCFANPEIAADLMKVKDSYNLNRIALAAGEAALKDHGWMRRNVDRVIETRETATRRLAAMGFMVAPSQSNFILARLPGRDLGNLARELRKAGILVRHFATALLRDALRISIGTPAEMRALYRALESLLMAGRARHSRRAMR